MNVQYRSRQILFHGPALVMVGLCRGFGVPLTPHPRLDLGAPIQFISSGLLFIERRTWFRAVVVSMLIWAPNLPAYQIRLFPASEVFDPDTEILHERLGVRGQPLTVQFDHLMILERREATKAEPLVPRLVLDLIDGTRLVGSYSGDPILAAVPRQNMEIHLDDILSMRFQMETNLATILLKAGGKLSGQARFSALSIETVVGELSVPREKIRQLKVNPRGEYRPGRSERRKRGDPEFHADEPSFAGKKLRTWLEQTGEKPQAGNVAHLMLALDADAKSPEWQASEQAIRQMGTQAIPFLIEMVSRADRDTADAYRAVRGFEALGDRARTAVPELLLLLNEPNELVRGTAMWAIGNIGPAASNAIPYLMIELRTGSLPAAEALGNIGPASVEAVPILIARLESGQSGYDVPLIVALGKIRSSESVPVLTKVAEGKRVRHGLESRHLEAALGRHRAVDALGTIGPAASGAVPVLVQLLKSRGSGGRGDPFFTERIIRALGSIGPGAREAVPALREIVTTERSGPGSLGSLKASAEASLEKIQSGATLH